LRAAITAREEGSRNTGLMDRWQVRPAWPADRAGSHICYQPVYGLQGAHTDRCGGMGDFSEADRASAIGVVPTGTPPARWPRMARLIPDCPGRNGAVQEHCTLWLAVAPLWRSGWACGHRTPHLVVGQFEPPPINSQRSGRAPWKLADMAKVVEDWEASKVA
jgi:hypothetical protein